jgi:DNA repair exonuclease SbcCD ATPase subunit
MITIKTLTFDYWFSYGKENELDFTKETLTQLKGNNGDGKSSIALILQELYYGKNIKNIKKQDLLNRKFPGEALYAHSSFTDGVDEYEIELHRKSSLKLVLRKNGEDISSHTSTGTYKSLENIMKMDFKTFAQLTYQSSISSLQFLMATDTNRKTFLVSLFNLLKYTKLFDTFKDEVRKVSKQVAEQDGKIETISQWVKQHEALDRTEKETMIVPVVLEIHTQEIARLSDDLKNFTERNKKIADNNAYIEMRNSLDITMLSEDVKIDDSDEFENEKTKCDVAIVFETGKLNVSLAEVRKLEMDIREIESIPVSCDKCGQAWPEKGNPGKITELRNRIKSEIDEQVLINDTLIALRANKQHAEIELQKIVQQRQKAVKCKQVKEEFERLTTLIDSTLPTKLLDGKEITLKIQEHSTEKMKQEKARDEAIKYNSEISAHNAKVKVINDQLEEYNSNLEKEFGILGEYEDLLDKLEVLKKAFSSTGLIAYKLEYLVKDLESEINNYLLELSGGKFQIEFNLKGEKLNIDIINNGKVVTIESLSDGERSRVNISTLLAIRKMMAELSSTQINILFLDEIMGVLDETGKEELVGILLKENLNTYLVSHEYTHPLVPAITVIKENEESRIEH